MRIAKYIPNTITSINLACGATGLMFVGMGRIDIAFMLMLAGSLADFCDGLSARALGAYSPMGKELDSLADLVSFGVLPAAMLSSTLAEIHGTYSIITWIPMMLSVFSGLRLAKFNIDERQTTSFLGLPTPGCAMVGGSLAYFINACPETAFAQFCSNNWFIPTLSCILCFLLVSEIPMFSMKIHKGEGFNRDMKLRVIFFGAMICSFTMVLVAQLNWSLCIFCSFVAYIIINLISAVIVRLKK